MTKNFFLLLALFEYIHFKFKNEAGFFEGDIAGVNINGKGLGQLTTVNNKWPNGVVAYRIDLDTGYSNFKKYKRFLIINPLYPFYFNLKADIHLGRIYAGMKLIEDQTRVNGNDCIKFVPRTNEQSYLRIM